MIIKEINNEQLEKYKKLVTEHGTVFNSYEWKTEIHPGAMKIYGIYEDDGQMIGAFHLYFKNVFGLSFIKNPPYIPHIGLIYNNRSSNPSSALTFNKKIADLICEFIQNLSPAVVSVALPPAIIDTQPFFWNKYKVIPNYTYRLSLDIPEEEIEKKYSPEHRNSLKKAIKENIRVEQCSDHAIVKKLILNTFERKNEAVNVEVIDKILFKLANSENSFAYVAYLNDKPIAASFCLIDKKCCYYLLGGYDAALKHQGGGILCVHNSILNAKRRGAKIFDFEGSMIKEVERYFRSFGPELVPYYTLNKAKLPFEIALKFIKRQLF